MKRTVRRLLGWCRDPYRDKPKWTDKAVAFLTLGIVALAAMQWKETDDSGKQTNEIIAADKRLAKAMEDSVTKAGAALDASIYASRTDQRAWIGVDTIAGTFQAGQKIDFFVNLKNSGKTPAININSMSGAEFVPRGGRPHFSSPTEHPYHTGTRAPGAVIGFQFSEFTLDPSLPPAFEKKQRVVIASPPIISLIEAGDVRLYVHGRVNYADVFGRQHWTTWCAYLPNSFHATVQFTACENHNDTDDEKGQRPNWDTTGR